MKLITTLQNPFTGLIVSIYQDELNRLFQASTSKNIGRTSIHEIEHESIRSVTKYTQPNAKNYINGLKRVYCYVEITKYVDPSGILINPK